jgi:ribosomal protein S6--L-glutamate ligase
MKRVLILSTAVVESDRQIALDFTRQFADRSEGWVEAECLFFRDLDFVIEDGRLEITDRVSGRSLSEADLVFFKTWAYYPEHAAAIVSYLDGRGIPHYNSEVANRRADTKIGELAAMATAGLPVPDSVFCLPLAIPDMLEARVGSWAFPMVMKSAAASKGDANFLVNSTAQIHELLKEHGEQPFIFQKFIPNTYDYRVLIMGGEIVAVIKRIRQSDEHHLNNTSKGAVGELVAPDKLSAAMRRAALKAAALFSRDVAGVDILPVGGDDRDFVILEVNKRPQMNTGAHIGVKMDGFTGFIAGKLGRKKT